MFYEKDWILRQINMLVQFVARTVFHKNTVEYEIEDEQNLTNTDLLYNRIKALLTENKICEAENILFDNLDDKNPGYLALALDFYQTINKLSDQELEEHNFSRQEINDGLREIIYQHSKLSILPFDE